MRIVNRTLTALTLILGLSGAASAGTLASGAILANTGDQALCIPSNVGTGNVTVQSVRILFYEGSNLVFGSSCSATLAAGNSCYSVANVPQDGEVRCEISVAGNAKTVRGTLQVKDSAGVIRAVTDAR